MYIDVLTDVNCCIDWCLLLCLIDVYWCIDYGYWYILLLHSNHQINLHSVEIVTSDEFSGCVECSLAILSVDTTTCHNLSQIIQGYTQQQKY